MKLFLWLLQIVVEMVRWPTYPLSPVELVGNISYGSRGVCYTLMFAMVVTYEEKRMAEKQL